MGFRAITVLRRGADRCVPAGGTKYSQPCGILFPFGDLPSFACYFLPVLLYIYRNNFDMLYSGREGA